MYTQHGAKRCQQRGITPDVIDAIIAYGKGSQRHGAEVYYMDRSARRRAAAELGPRRYAQLADKLNRYVVLSDDGSLITAAPRRRRLKF